MRTVNIPGGDGPSNPPPPPPSDDVDPLPPGAAGGVLVYDCEIKRACRSSRDADPPIEGIEYCKWNEYDKMGISVATVYDFSTSRYRVFMDDNLQALRELIEQRDVLIGFNSHRFDDNLIAANGITLRPGQAADLLSAVWQGAGLGPTWAGTKYNGFGLDALYRANCPDGKAKDDAASMMAPVWYQRGEIGKVIDHGLNDTQMTVELIMQACAHGTLVNPKDPEGPLLAVREFLPAGLLNLIPWENAVPRGE